MIRGLIFACQLAPLDEATRAMTGKKMQSYLEWTEICYAVTLTGLPAISVPCGFTASTLPVGLQIVGRRNDGIGELRFAHAFEKAAKIPRPLVPKI